jgi:hypothetical protein
MLLNYNLPPWLVTKRFFIMLALIIHGRKSVTSEHFDLYIEPLLEELRYLWGGVQTWDAANYGGTQRFCLRAILVWSIHDFPIYGMVAGCTTKGFLGCPMCGPNTRSQRSRALKKNVYDHQSRKELPVNHGFRRHDSFLGRTGGGSIHSAHYRRLGTCLGREREEFLDVPNSAEDPVHRHEIKRVSALFTLPYWQVSVIAELIRIRL